MNELAPAQLLPLLAPPLLGALIGYVTNHVAIRMLFRPLHPWRLLGLRLPLTPGIIPAKRGELAQKMGEMVGSHLLTSADVGRALEKEGFRRELRQAVSDKLGELLDRELGPPDSLVPREFQGRFRELVDLLRWKAVGTVFDYLQGEEFARRLSDYLQRKGDELLARDLAALLPEERYRQLQQHLEGRLAALLASPELARGIGRFIDERSERLLASQRPLRELLPADLVELLLEQLEKELPPLLERFGGLLYDPDFRTRLVARGRQAIDQFLDSLGGLAGLLSGFIDLNALYAKIPGFLDKAGDEIARWLKEEKTQQQVATLLRERLDALLDRPLASYLENVSYEKVSGVRGFVRERVIGLVQGPKAAAFAGQLAGLGLHKLRDRSFRALLEESLPPESLPQLRSLLAEQILATLRAPAARQALEQVLAERLEHWVYRRPIGRLASRLPADVREELEAGLCRLLADMLKKEVPPLVETLNVARMVEEKVNGLDILQVEGLLMGIMKEQFKYINLFGALLGLLIGLCNLLLLRLA